MTVTIETRPWGEFHILFDGTDCKIKRLVVHPQKHIFTLLYFYSFLFIVWFETQCFITYTVSGEY
jgi:hypothetical protein